MLGRDERHLSAGARAAGATLLALFAVVGCRSSGPAEPERWSDAWLEREADRYLGSVESRRASLEASLVNPANIYSKQRLASYGKVTSGWDALPEWNPRSRPVDRAALDAFAAKTWPELPAARLWDGVRPTDRAGWISLGRRVFFEYPLRAEVGVEHALAPWIADAAAVAASSGEALGIERARDGALPGIVAFDDVDGRNRIGITCAACHTAVKDGGVVAGAARRRFDLGGLRLAYYRDTGAPVEPGLARRMATWGPGRADVTEDDDEDPVAIPDLWGLRDETHLTQAGTIRHIGPAALALRQETQLLHANALRVRPPRELAWALATYLYSLEPPPARAVTDPTAVATGAALFEVHCRSCHSRPDGGGEPIPVARVGTDPSLANGKARGTGTYRVTSLVRVADAGPYFHDGSVPSLDAVLSADRLAPGYTAGARGPGPIHGHAFGTSMPPAERAALVSYLESL